LREEERLAEGRRRLQAQEDADAARLLESGVSPGARARSDATQARQERLSAERVLAIPPLQLTLSPAETEEEAAAALQGVLFIQRWWRWRKPLAIAAECFQIPIYDVISIRHLFDAYDLLQMGSLNRDEVSSALRAVGIKVSEEEVRASHVYDGSDPGDDISFIRFLVRKPPSPPSRARPVARCSSCRLSDWMKLPHLCGHDDKLPYCGEYSRLIQSQRSLIRLSGGSSWWDRTSQQREGPDSRSSTLATHSKLRARMRTWRLRSKRLAAYSGGGDIASLYFWRPSGSTCIFTMSSQ